MSVKKLFLNHLKGNKFGQVNIFSVSCILKKLELFIFRKIAAIFLIFQHFPNVLADFEKV